jgi:hypothetical protein
MNYEVIVSVPMRVQLDGEFETVTKQAMEIATAAQAQLTKAVKDADYVEILKPKIMSAVLK